MLRMLLANLAFVLLAGVAAAQSANIAVGTGAFDASLPVEVTADELSVNQSTGQAVFQGNVLIVQGEVRLSAGSVTIEYAPEGSANAISLLLASGGVTFVTSKGLLFVSNMTRTVQLSSL